MPFSMRVVGTAALLGAYRAGGVTSAVYDMTASQGRHEYTDSLTNEALNAPITCAGASCFSRSRTLSRPRFGPIHDGNEVVKTLFDRHTLMVLVLATLCGFFAATGSALAQDTIWTGNGNWLDTDRWSKGVPSAQDGAWISSGSVKVESPGAVAAFLAVNNAEIAVQNGGIVPGVAGTLAVSILDVGYLGNGALRIRTGGRVSSGSASISFFGGSTGIVTVDGATGVVPGGATWTNTGALFVGFAGFGTGSGTLNIVNGGMVSSATSSIGSGNATGIATVDNSTWTNTGFLRVGDGGTGELYIQNHGTVGDSIGAIGAGTPSNSTPSSGTVRVDNATWTNADDLYLGSSSNGTLIVLNGGKVSNNSAYLGYEASSTGAADVNNSTWTNAGALIVGVYGTGTLEFHNGSTVTSALGMLGRYADAIGSVTVDHATWTNTSDLYVGTDSDSRGTLLIRNGGTVSSTAGSIGFWTRSTGTATVKGVRAGGAPSTWTVSGNLYVGDRGTGTLNIEDGGIVSIGSTHVSDRLGSSGTLNLTGTASARGALETRQVSNGDGAGPGTGAINFNGGILRATANQAEVLRNFHTPDAVINSGGAFIDSNTHDIGISTPLWGAGGLTKVGIGTLSLTGINIYAGLTSVDAGKLSVNGSIAGDVLVKSGAILGGGGTILGAVTVAPGGILSPGNSPDTLTLGALTLDGQAALTIELGASSDRLVVNGNLTLNGTINLVGDPGSFANGSLPYFISYSGALINNGIVIGSVPAGFSVSDFALDFGTPGMVRVYRVLPALSPIDIDGNNIYDALSDGLLIIRYLFGLTGPALTNGALGGTASRTDPAAIKSYLDGIRTSLDIDGNGTADALTDGMLIIRYLFGLRGNALIAGAVGPLATRTAAPAIEAYIQTLMP
jgi:T5SS/PEP-CTERM-associated repeat protein/autotransporter-associated beta strand protein